MHNAATDPAMWEGDALNRKLDADFLRRFLERRLEERRNAGRPASYVLNIDAGWGRGKSFFLDRFGRELASVGYLVARVNAWQDDHADDPLLSVMDAIDEVVQPVLKKERTAKKRWTDTKRATGAIAVAAAKGLAVQGAKFVLGAAVDEVIEIAKATKPAAADKVVDEIAQAVGRSIDERGKRLLEEFREGKRTIKKFRGTLGDFLKIIASKEQRLPLFVLVDELDRCRPPFAIAMLERIKHLFEIDNVVFVVATDTKQLSHSVGAVYGSGFNGEAYLGRFFDRSYHFVDNSPRDIIRGLLASYPIDESVVSLPAGVSVESFLISGFEYFGLAPRDINQAYDILRNVITVWPSATVQVELIVLFPIVVAYQQRFDLVLNNDFGANVQKLIQKRPADVTPWRVKNSPIDCLDLANKLVRRVSRSMRDALESTPNDEVDRWILQRLAHEFEGLRQYTSIIRQYPDMVKTAGRLTETTTTIDRSGRSD